MSCFFKSSFFNVETLAQVCCVYNNVNCACIFDRHLLLSHSSQCAFEMMGNDEYTETARFCYMFDRFFDCLNTRSIGEGCNK